MITLKKETVQNWETPIVSHHNKEKCNDKYQWQDTKHDHQELDYVLPLFVGFLGVLTFNHTYKAKISQKSLSRWKSRFYPWTWIRPGWQYPWEPSSIVALGSLEVSKPFSPSTLVTSWTRSTFGSVWPQSSWPVSEDTKDVQAIHDCSRSLVSCLPPHWLPYCLKSA